MKVAAYQAPIAASGTIANGIDHVRQRVNWCESMNVEILCCPEGMLGGLADDVPNPAEIAINVDIIVADIETASVRDGADDRNHRRP